MTDVTFGRRARSGSSGRLWLSAPLCRGLPAATGSPPRVLFRWKQELAPPPAPVFLPVTTSDAPEPSALNCPSPPITVGAPIIVGRLPQEIEVELVGGRRVRVARDTDPETVRTLVWRFWKEKRRDDAPLRCEGAYCCGPHRYAQGERTSSP